ncbi:MULTISPECIES: helix-turn-helix transcriptional regulator [Bacillus]|uniref:helix-turn-helix transcriptional regulator n=1 Tax=Bacillus TaxID=1386 RepID=UPI000779917D|nr:helix-turn-helix transcriptional regulator [Bacillus amyloliquefaciens]MBW8278652.1 helix-turn-helix transcriptional regulator [Bacillus amyloliquefaciens]MEC1248089.1 helix-turn-helix transcriptional regulator [Bacillus amyloliquefaciens]MEC2253377.1 helix-turn-helix transcriptional regulator [Bacillus amyloliquefaciens]MEC5259353.1 helix-turn-helix transcriptional regulator [Bacillus amyloliquefaciens]MED0753001.1 helix-turn-helix transcriptional regulator [Bacillus amyloliquefaciens]
MENRLKEIRQRHSYSQETLALKLKVSRQTIISIENGKYNPSLPLALKIAKIFRESVDNIFLLEEE